jgi:hypothetical protein
MATRADVEDAAYAAYSEATDKALGVLIDLEHECWRADDSAGSAALKTAIALIRELEA